MPPTTDMTLPQRLWSWGCSLKLAIYVASLATLLIMGGSLTMHKHPQLFGPMDDMLMADWLAGAWQQAPQRVWWIPASALCLVIFAINTLCCLIDWLLKIGSRWRKTGEYLIHTGFILLVIAYGWNSFAGFRSGPHRLFPGERLELRPMPGYAIQLEEFTAELSDTGRPLDMINRLSLWRDEAPIKEREVRINQPLTHGGLVVLATSFGRSLTGFTFHLPGRGLLDLAPGSRLELDDGGSLTVLALLPNVRRTSADQVQPIGDQLGNPALQLRLQRADGSSWQGWYLLREPPPRELRAVNLHLRPMEPRFRDYSLLTINRDPGSGLAAAGALCMTFGVLLAFVSFYAKRARGDRPEV
ncbi:MAG: cytochrome c biogenesis protein ResB [Desulfuromonadales bacterium]|nr:cytochrome c biogenesis protein ResB [Desulfuromonadales bacterium]